VREAVGEKIFNDPSKFCPFTVLSRGKWAFACCVSEGKPGHLYPNKGAHDFKNYPTGSRSKVLSLLTLMAATTESAFVGPSAAGGCARHGGVPCLAPTVFDTVGGVIFVPVRYATPHNPEIGLPRSRRMRRTRSSGTDRCREVLVDFLRASAAPAADASPLPPTAKEEASSSGSDAAS